MFIFLTVETLQIFRKRVGGDDILVSNSFQTNLVKKWLVPYESGGHQFRFSLTFGGVLTITDKEAYTRGLSESVHNGAIFTKPIMYTVELEPISGEERIIGYSLDRLFSGVEIFNDDIVNDGNQKIYKLDGGDITLNSAGTTWDVVTDSGTLLSPTGVELHVNPWLMYRTPDIS